MPSRRRVHSGGAGGVDRAGRPSHSDNRRPRCARRRAIAGASSSLLVVLDVRSPWAGDLAREARRLGIKVVRTSGDITDFWYTDLSRRWKDAPVAIAGVTAQGPLFCLERFGWDHGLRVVFRDTPGAPAPDGETLLSWVIAPKPPQGSSTPSRQRGPEWRFRPA